MLQLPRVVEFDNWPLDLAPDYEHGALFIRRGFDVPHFDVLSKITCRSSDRLFKKMSTERLAENLNHGHVIYQLTENPKHAKTLQKMLMEAHEHSRDYVKSLFPKYLWNGKVKSTYRFCETKDEDIHWDIYNYPYPFVRAFVNLDAEPRVWNIGPNLLDYYTEHGGEIQKHRNDEIGTLAHAAAQRFDKLHDGPIQRMEFEPGTMWIVQSQLVAHQIIYGRRMLAMSIAYDPGSMSDPTYAPTELATRIKAHG